MELPNLSRAIESIMRYERREFGMVNDAEYYADQLNEIGIAYTTITDDEIEVQTYVNLCDNRITFTIRDPAGTWRVWETEEYSDNELLDILDYLDFNDCIPSNLEVEDFLEDGNSLEDLPEYGV